jgi:hypothetical protein
MEIVNNYKDSNISKFYDNFLNKYLFFINKVFPVYYTELDTLENQLLEYFRNDK